MAERFVISTPGRGFTDITRQVAAAAAAAGPVSGVVHVFVRHTSCSLLISENADPSVRQDLQQWMAQLVPDGDPAYSHDMEGPDDMPAHIRSMLTGVSLTVPLLEGRLLLGTWQGIYLWEHRHRGHRRELVVTCLPGT